MHLLIMCLIFILSLPSSKLAASEIEVVSNIDSIEVINSIPKGSGSQISEYAKYDCKDYLVQPELKSANALFENSWQITSQLAYGPYEIIGFVGEIEMAHNNCHFSQTNIAIFHKSVLLGIFKTTNRTGIALNNFELGQDAKIAIYQLNSDIKEAEITFRHNKVALEVPGNSIACNINDIVPNISGLEINEARNVLFDYGWKPRDGKLIHDMGDMQFWFSVERAVTPELVFCGNTCTYAYEKENSYLEVYGLDDVISTKASCKN